MPKPQVSPLLDIFGIQQNLNAEQCMVQETVRNFVLKEAVPCIREAYRTEEFPMQLVPKMGALGVFGATLRGYGLPGIDAISYGLMMRELERGDSSLRSFASVQGALVMYPIHAFGSEEQKVTWLPKLGTGENIGCFGLTESEGGSDPASMKTFSENCGDHWVLRGTKTWITNGDIAKVAVIWAKTENGIRGFLVPANTTGFSGTRIRGKLSLRASITSELTFDNVKLPLNAILPGTDGLKSALKCLNQARYSIAWGALGAAESCYQEALSFAKIRVVFGKPIAQFQLVQRKLALMATEITKGQLLAYRLGQLKNQGTLHHSQVSLAKRANVEMALCVARTAREILGANGIMDEYQSMRHLCNLESVFTYEGTNDVHLLVLGEELTGYSAFT